MELTSSTSIGNQYVQHVVAEGSKHRLAITLGPDVVYQAPARETPEQARQDVLRWLYMPQTNHEMQIINKVLRRHKVGK